MLMTVGIFEGVNEAQRTLLLVIVLLFQLFRQCMSSLPFCREGAGRNQGETHCVGS
ncbi:hypothetical protein K443DRAFT_553078 [Laccaria amethystina LaAM-08-1]|uniref:Uncharacterized protein n=1 Tax=Laccaria amethystina LaAM-08-1 TaxID=1095629 RepID=A0A0C9XVM7_9AGAR|nr:hypothetical protein K443DRAFT_553078 [Laccaria amethystina LaAM-08-1]